jgi:hypothetical protein
LQYAYQINNELKGITRACPLWSRTMKHGAVSSTVQGGGKRRGGGSVMFVPLYDRSYGPPSASAPSLLSR